MLPTLWIIAVGLWVLWVAQAVISALMMHKLYRRLLPARTTRYDNFQPHIAVIVPFKGLEPGLEDHVRRLCAQRYRNYRLLFVVEDDQDPAARLLGQIAAEPGHPPIAVLSAGQAPPTRGQKVHNQLCAIEHLRQADYGESVWVFADSDAAPGEHWLFDLAGPLERPETGCSTGYRWLIPQPNANGRVHPGSRFASIFNASATGFLVRERFVYAWGGSMAIRRDDALAWDYPGRLAQTLSDDYMMSRMLGEQNLRIYFVPKCLVASPVAMDWHGLAHFARRQYRITKVYAPRLYYAALWLPVLYIAGWLTAAAAVIGGLAIGDIGWWAAGLAAIGLVVGGDQIRAAYRRRVVQQAFGPQMARQLADTLAWDRWATPLWMAVNGVLLWSCLLGRTINWRGKWYRMDSPTQTRRIDPTQATDQPQTTGGNSSQGT